MFTCMSSKGPGFYYLGLVDFGLFCLFHVSRFVAL